MSKKYIIHLQLVTLTDDEKPINSEIAFTHTIETIEESYEDWRVYQRHPVRKLYSGGKTEAEAIANHIVYTFNEKGLA